MYKKTLAVVIGLLGLVVSSADASVLSQPVYNEQGEIIGTTRSGSVAATGPELPEGYSMLTVKQGDVTGDGIADTVYLVGRKEKADSIYAADLCLIVKNGQDNSLYRKPLEQVGGYDARLFLGDFSGDHVDDVYVETASGGSGGWYYHNIVTFRNGEAKEIFGKQDNETAYLTGTFQDGWKVELKNRLNGRTLLLDLHDRQADYVRLGLYKENGTLVGDNRAMPAPYGRMEAADIDGDGVYELTGLQRISGAYRADGLADIETVLKYSGSAWQATSVRVTIPMGSGQATPARPQ